MGRSPCCEKAHTNRGAWTKEEDQRLIDHIRIHGEGCWRSLPKAAGLLRCGKSCRLRWINYLRPDLKRGNFTEEEDELIIKLHSLLGNKWSLIAGRLPGRTDNEIKNYWNTHIKRKLLSRGLDPQTHRPLNTTITGPVAVTDAAADKKLKSEFKNTTRPLSIPITEISLISQSIDATNKNPDADFKVRSESIEGGSCNSGTTDDVQQEKEKVEQTHKNRGHELDLELSIGLVPFQASSTAESKEHGIQPPLQFQPENTPYAAATWASKVVDPVVCLCCHLGFQNGQACYNCRRTGDDFNRWITPLGS
ncbi:hypothetical protein Nepgr_023637 [Nepenthes gracilis]|uniref:Uncharacterized protein n=1 Tax=Nepenthes gracilis TaxID=150966 RepID=A0AAD3XZA5_NEPGR|nr:hypothetical protein Nepgr_023637 [Nepenthes gracilis]